MKRIINPNMLLSYIEKYDLNSIFEREMIKYMELFCFDKGELICVKGSEMKYIYFLVNGKLKVYTLHDNGKSILLRFYKPLNLLGDVEFLSGFKIQCNVESLNETTLIGIPFIVLHENASCDSKFLKFIIKSLSQKVYTTSNLTSMNLLFPLENRFASYLLSISVDDCTDSNISQIKTTNLTELAALLGTSYRHLNRIMNDFIRNDIIQKEKGIIKIKNINRLKELSGGNLYE